MTKLVSTLATVVGFLAPMAPSYADQQFADAELALSEYFLLPMVGRYGRVPIHVDPVQAKIATGTWQPPQAGDTLLDYSGQSREWVTAKSAQDGWLVDDALRGGYAYTHVTAAQPQVVLLEATGHAMVFVNGEPRAGDPYLTERTTLPVLLTPGKNEFLFHVAAGKLKARLIKPDGSLVFNTTDITAPSLVRGETQPVWVGIVLVNARDQELVDTQVACDTDGGHRMTTVADSIPPFGVRKIALPIKPPHWDDVPADVNQIKVRVTLGDPRRRQPLATTEIALTVVEPGDVQTRTFRSAIDGSVQEYCLLPARETPTNSAHETGLLVTLHEAGETAYEHLADLEPYQDVHLLAPSGRRAEGCDWEDWSARDALEALDDAAKHVKFAKNRVWLRGTDAGGHGVLRLGGMAADRWAALVPRDPWLEYPLEAGDEPDPPVEAMLERVTWSNRLTPLLRNTAICEVLLEQSSDSPSAMELRELFSAFHPKFTAQTPAGETNSFESALQICKKRVSPQLASVEEVDMVTYNPGENAQMHWLTILNQQNAGELSRAAVRFDSDRNMLLGLTVNVAALAIDVSHLVPDTIVEVVLDGEPVGEFAVEDKPLTFLRTKAGWQIVPLLPPSFKQPQRYGGIRSIFLNQPVLVYGTRGTSAERAWALAKARYDAETILVRLNGSVDVVADLHFKANQVPDRNVVLYGNADTNSVWPRLLSTSPVQMRGEGVWIDRRPEQGDDVACVFVRPRRGSETAVVGVVGGTQLAGMRATDRLPYFVNGTEFPDLLLFSSKSLSEGNADVRAAGYFGRVWAVDPGEIAWRDAAL